MSQTCRECPYVEDINELKENVSDLKADGREYKVEIKNLCEKVDNLVTTLRWGIGLMIPTLMTLIGLFFKK